MLKMESAYSTRVLLLLACILYLLTAVDMFRDYSSPYNNPCGASATQAHQGDIAYYTVGNDGAREKRGATAIRARLWPDARIPYEISPVFNTAERNDIYRAMRHWEENTCIRFYERPSDHNESYIYIFRGGCCASYVGRQTEDLQQGVSLGAGCIKFSTKVHELGHAIGFWHEQSRPDRDAYINLLWNNMMSGTQSNFEMEEIDSLGVGYDYNSIMHYSSTAFGAGSITIEAIDTSIPVGEAVELSSLDILQANLLYQCDPNNLSPILTPNVTDDEENDEMPPLPGTCAQDIIVTSESEYAGEDFYSSDYPTYSHNQDCVYRIVVPEGTILNVTVIDLNLEWSNGCSKDSLTIYQSVDGSGYARWPSRCGSGSDMSVTMETNVAYVKFISDGENQYLGRRGFYATFTAKDIDECQEDNGGCSQHCVNHVPGYSCLCDSGWFLSGDMKTCFDFNECAIGNGGCQDKCVNSGGSFECQCPEDSTLNADGRTCSNPETSCDVNNGGCDHVCSDTGMGVSCHCREGYRLLSDGATCQDINECVEGNTCSYGGCTNTPGSYECVCNTGYEMDPNSNTCINVDECARGLHICQGDSQCQDTDGSYVCTCGVGLTGSSNGLNCIDIDECQDPTICTHGCQNTYGSYECLCPLGYQHEVIGTDSCIDINECEEGACSNMANSICLNSDGSFECQCDAGFVLSADQQSCEPIPTLAPTTEPPFQATVTPLVDECSVRNGGCEHTCVDTVESYYCECPPEKILDADGHSCKCGGFFTADNGSFNTPGWPASYPQENFECEWTINLTNPDAIVKLTIDDSAYGIAGRPPCPIDHVMFLDGADDSAAVLGKFCKFEGRGVTLSTSSSEARVVFTGTKKNNRPANRVGVRVTYTLLVLVNECETDNGGCEHACVDTEESYYCECPTGYRVADDDHSCVDIDECSEQPNYCESGCVNTNGSFTCTCPPDKILDTDGHSCKCGGIFTAVNGSFNTPGWPYEYPMDEFECEWLIDLPNPNTVVQLTIDDTAYGISGKPPCNKDHIMFFDGMNEDDSVLGKFCKFEGLGATITTSSSQARVVFTGLRTNSRLARRVGVRVMYTMMEPTK